MANPYDERYARRPYYWGLRPSKLCFQVLQLLPPERPVRLLDIGCGEGRNAVFFARNGYHVSAFDASAAGVEKTRRLAEETRVPLEAFAADLLEYRLTEPYDVLFSTGALHYIPADKRSEILGNYRAFTRPGGLNAFSVFVSKPFIARAPDAEETAARWISGELLTHYHDWKIEFCSEEIFDCMSSGVPHRHAVNRMIARNGEGAR
jgi:tellurite methyltransferase